MKNLEDFKDYEGIDISPKISLYEYGLMCKKYDKDYPDEYHVIYGVECDDRGNFNLFESAYKRESELDNLVLGKEWLDQRGIESFFNTIDTPIGEWLKLPFYMKLHDLVSHFGFMDILGSVYYGFEIREFETAE